MYPLDLDRLASTGSSLTRAPIHSALEALPYGSRIAVVHEHWDGCARPRNIDYGTRRLGDHEPYPSHGSGSPRGVYWGRRGRLEVTLRS